MCKKKREETSPLRTDNRSSHGWPLLSLSRWFSSRHYLLSRYKVVTDHHSFKFTFQMIILDSIRYDTMWYSMLASHKPTRNYAPGWYSLELLRSCYLRSPQWHCDYHTLHSYQLAFMSLCTGVRNTCIVYFFSLYLRNSRVYALEGREEETISCR